jgi:NTP pyrophosphatase (non-canonical NTP hydrolase)
MNQNQPERRQPAGRSFGAVILAVSEERHAQDARWGEQNHDPLTWIAILSEEVGEAAAEALNVSRGVRPADREALLAELVQVAAVAVAAIESLERQQARAAAAGSEEGSTWSRA